MKNVTKLDDIYNSDNNSDSDSDSDSESDRDNDSETSSKSLFSITNLNFILAILQLTLIGILLYFILKIYRYTHKI
jgi:hypothetical protein